MNRLWWTDMSSSNAAQSTRAATTFARVSRRQATARLPPGRLDAPLPAAAGGFRAWAEPNAASCVSPTSASIAHETVDGGMPPAVTALLDAMPALPAALADLIASYLPAWRVGDYVWVIHAGEPGRTLDAAKSAAFEGDGWECVPPSVMLEHYGRSDQTHLRIDGVVAACHANHVLIGYSTLIFGEWVHWCGMRLCCSNCPFILSGVCCCRSGSARLLEPATLACPNELRPVRQVRGGVPLLFARELPLDRLPATARVNIMQRCQHLNAQEPFTHELANAKYLSPSQRCSFARCDLLACCVSGVIWMRCMWRRSTCWRSVAAGD